MRIVKDNSRLSEKPIVCFNCKSELWMPEQNNKKCGNCFTCKQVEESVEKIKDDSLLDFIMQVELQNKKEK
jgi:hypothetical protein